jgi:two-component system, NtrC family, sensor kinase
MGSNDKDSRKLARWIDPQTVPLMKNKSSCEGRWLTYRGCRYCAPRPVPVDCTANTSLWHRQRLTRLWDNSSFRTKLTALLVGTALLQGLVVTQGMLYAIEQQLLVTAEQSLQRELLYFREVLDRRLTDQAQLAKKIQHELEQHVIVPAPEQLTERVSDPLVLDPIFDRAHQELAANFYLITNVRGQVVAQRVYELTDDFQRSPQGLDSATSSRWWLSDTSYYRRVDSPRAVDLSGLSSIRAAIARQQPFSGHELLEEMTIEQLGLVRQTKITTQEPQISQRSRFNQPLPSRRFSIHRGLVLISVQPIWAKGRIVGTVVVGTLANRNAHLLDDIVANRVDYASLYIGDRVVTTNLPDRSGVGRAIGFPALLQPTQPTASKLLRHSYRGQTLLTMYAPLYDVRHTLSSTKRQPIGLYSVSQSEAKARTLMGDTLKLGYGLAAGLFLGSVAFALVLSKGLSRSLWHLTRFAQRLGSGDTQARVNLDQRKDEIGILAQELNQMAERIEFQLETIHWAEQQSRTQAASLAETLQTLRQTQAQLVQTEKMSSLGQLVAGVAHEINNPITFIHGNLSYVSQYARELLDLLAQYHRYYPHPPDELQTQLARADLDFIQTDMQKLLDSMTHGSDRIRHIIHTLRNFARLDEVGIKAVDLHEGIEGALQFLNHRLMRTPEQPAICVIKNYAVLPWVDCYPGELNQVFMHLLSNAIDALRSQSCLLVSPEIQIRTECLGSDRVQITIADNGKGIPPEVQAKIFDPFFTTKPVGQGTGLGLTASYQVVVDQHRGQLTCSSEEGKGTAFQIQLPIRL